MKKKLVTALGALAVIIIVSIFFLTIQEKPWPVLPPYPIDRAQQLNVQMVDNKGERVTTFEVYEIEGDTGLKAANSFYSDILVVSGWDPTFTRLKGIKPYLKDQVFYYTKDSSGIDLFGATLFASCPPFKLVMNLEQLDAEKGLVKVTLRQSRYSCP